MTNKFGTKYIFWLCDIMATCIITTCQNDYANFLFKTCCMSNFMGRHFFIRCHFDRKSLCRVVTGAQSLCGPANMFDFDISYRFRFSDFRHFGVRHYAAKLLIRKDFYKNYENFKIKSKFLKINQLKEKLHSSQPFSRPPFKQTLLDAYLDYKFIHFRLKAD